MRHSAVSKSYLNVLPLGDDKLDMFAVFNGIHPQMTKWTELFYNQTTFETDIHAEFHNAEQFRQFYFETKNIQKTRGQNPFGFGFPFVFDTVIARDEASLRGTKQEGGQLLRRFLFGISISNRIRRVAIHGCCHMMTLERWRSMSISWLIFVKNMDLI